jgi:hypothetical protein
MAAGYFSRRARYFLVDDMNTEEGFDAYPVDVPYRTKLQCRALKEVLDKMYESFEMNPAPEECAQEECDKWVALLDELFATKWKTPGRPSKEDDDG